MDQWQTRLVSDEQQLHAIERLVSTMQLRDSWISIADGGDAALTHACIAALQQRGVAVVEPREPQGEPQAGATRVVVHRHQVWNIATAISDNALRRAVPSVGERSNP